MKFGVTTASAPARPLQRLASQTKFRLLPIAGAVMDRLAQARPGMVGLTLAANTYPGLKEPVRTAGSAALLVTTTDAPDGEVERLADLIFAGDAEVHSALRELRRDVGGRQVRDLDAGQPSDGAAIFARAARLHELEAGARKERFGIFLQPPL